MHASLLSGPVGQARSLRHPRWVTHYSSLQKPRFPAATSCMHACMHARTQSATPTRRRQTNSRAHSAVPESQGRAGQLLICSTASALLQAAGTPTSPGRACQRSCKWVHQTLRGQFQRYSTIAAAAAAAWHRQLGSSCLSHLFTHALLCPVLQSLCTTCLGSQRQRMSGTSSGPTGRKPSNSTPTSTKR